MQVFFEYFEKYATWSICEARDGDKILHGNSKLTASLLVHRRRLGS
jgi:hypothetical protein